MKRILLHCPLTAYIRIDLFFTGTWTETTTGDISHYDIDGTDWTMNFFLKNAQTVDANGTRGRRLIVLEKGGTIIVANNTTTPITHNYAFAPQGAATNEVLPMKSITVDLGMRLFDNQNSGMPVSEVDLATTIVFTMKYL